MNENSPAEANPYAAPTVMEDTVAERRNFPELSTRELYALRNHSHTIRTVAFLLMLGVVFMAIVIIVSMYSLHTRELLLIAPIFGWNLLTCIGLIKRHRWGWFVGFFAGALLLLGFPIGTLIGALFLFSLARGRRLFGPDRYLHTDLEAEWKYRKRNKVL
jgi:hypothetical protein